MTNDMVVDCTHPILKDHSYWPIVSDIINVFTHHDIAIYFLKDRRLIYFWSTIVSFFQGRWWTGCAYVSIS